MEKKEIARVEKIYKKTVNKLLSNPNKKATIEVKGKSFDTTAGKQASVLMKARVIAGDASNKNRAHTDGGALHPDSESGGIDITLKKNILRDVGDLGIRTTLVHESLHVNPDEKNMKELFKGEYDMNEFRDDHRGRYNGAANDLF